MNEEEITSEAYNRFQAEREAQLAYMMADPGWVDVPEMYRTMFENGYRAGYFDARHDLARADVA